jgi:DNA repair exonuclease SbcCD nuclease subunit
LVLYKLEKEKAFPSNITIINNSNMLYKINEKCNICGYEYDGEIDNDNINILLCYSGDNDKDINEALTKGFDYVALGGKHKKDNILNIGNTVIAAYSGSLVSIDFDNTDSKGYVYMKIDKERSYFDFIKCEETIFNTIEIDISECCNFKDLLQILNEKLNKEFIYKLELIGKMDVVYYSKMQLEEITKKYKNVIKIEDKIEIYYNSENSILKNIFTDRLREKIEDECLYKKCLKYGFVSMESKV